MEELEVLRCTVPGMDRRGVSVRLIFETICEDWLNLQNRSKVDKTQE